MATLPEAWELCKRLDEAANAATKARPVKPQTEDEAWGQVGRTIRRSEA